MFNQILKYPIFLPIALVLVFAGCGDDGDNGLIEGSMSDAAVADGDVSDQADSSNSTAQDSATPDSATRDTAPDLPMDFELCEPRRLGLKGTLDGETIAFQGSGSPTPLAGYSRMWRWLFFGFGEGRLWIDPMDELNQEGVPQDATALLRLPNASDEPPVWLCAGEGSTLTQTQEEATFEFSLQALKRLGACPGGTPVTGTVELCASFSPNGEKCTSEASGSAPSMAVTSTLEDWEIDGEYRVNSIGSFGGKVMFDLEDGRGLIEISDRAQGGYTGYFIVPGGKAVYCIEQASYREGDYDIGTPHRLSLRRLTRLDDCENAASIEGEIEGCSHDGDR